MIHLLFKQFFLGFASPIHSARFLFQKKYLFFLCILPHILNLILYFWIVSHYIIGKWLNPFLSSMEEKSNLKSIFVMIRPEFFEVIVWIAAFLLYGALGTSFINAIASPIYDYAAQKSYEYESGFKTPKQSISDFIDSIISEITKAVIVFCVFLISIFLTFLAPLFFIISIWYLGLIAIDRTLLLLNLPFKERILFGIRNIGLCLGLGIWCYIPFISTLFSFTLACAGARLVAKTPIPYLSDHSIGADF
jgi:hypothetical protein